MNTRKLTRTLAAIAGGAALMAFCGQAQASPGFNGAQPATLSGGNPFTVVGSTITVTQAATSTYLNIPGVTSGNVQLVAIDSLWVVTSTGGTVSGVTPGTATLTGPGQGPWSPVTGPAGFEGTNFGNQGNGGGNFIDLANQAALNAAGKSFHGYTSGTFTFNSIPAGSYLGIDYLLINGNTGRAYFPQTSGSPPVIGITATPEPSQTAAFGLGILGLAGLAFQARRRKAIAA